MCSLNSVWQIDGTANDVKGLKASSFPTLLFYPANAKDKPITYTGERTVRRGVKRPV